MTVAEVIAEVITADFLRPTIQRLGEQLRRNIGLSLKLALGEEIVQRQIFSSRCEAFEDISGEVRVLASDTAVARRYKYYLQCLFPQQDDLEGFSGIRLNGAVVVDSDDGAAGDNDYSGFIYTYNEWTWGKKVRDL